MVEKDSRELMVTIRCLVYNHEPYLRQCLDGFVMQQTNFRFEAIVHDDASTDGSAAIIREYAAKYPDIIKPIYEKENQYSKRDGSLRRIMNAHMHGKYVAYCEGDDYWTDPLKLQKQVDFLESHPDYVMCTHRFQILSEETKEFKEDWNGRFKAGLHFDLAHFMERNSWVTQPLSLLYRRSALNKEEYYKYKNSKDVTLMYYLLQQGKGLLMPDFMGVYRVHKGGVWQGVDRSKKIKAELDTVMAIYDVEKSKQAATLVKNSMRYFRYLGWPFFKHYFKIYARAINIICRELGLVETLKAVCRSIKFF